MKRPSWIGHSVCITMAAVLLTSCGRPADKAHAPSAAGPLVERPGPVSWNATTGGFELNGKPLRTVKLWTFDGSTEGFTAVGSKITPAPGQGIEVDVADPTIHSPRGLNVPGGQYPLVLVRLTRIAPASVWDGALYYTTAGHPESIAYFGKPLSGANPKVGETTTLVYDMSRQTVGAPDWTQATIDQIRIDLEDKPGGVFLIRQVAIAEDPDPAATAAALPAPKAHTPAPSTKP